jgi:predicted Zn-dependent protease
MRTAAYQRSLTVAFRQEVFQRMKEITDERKTSIAEYVRQAVDEALKKESSPDELRF